LDDEAARPLVVLDCAVAFTIGSLPPPKSLQIVFVLTGPYFRVPDLSKTAKGLIDDLDVVVETHDSIRVWGSARH
jgi:hypothetical protein